MYRPIALVLALAGLAACAPSTGNAPGSQAAASEGYARPCFQPARITNFTRGDTQQIYVKVLGGGVFALRSSGCPDFGTGFALQIAPATGIGDRLCVGDSAQVAAPNGSFGPGQCLARVERSLTDAEVEALPSRYRP